MSNWRSFLPDLKPVNVQVTIDKAADWWLGNLKSPWFCALEKAVEEEWGVKPLKIREGGSIPSVPFLEKIFECPALHLPMGQSSVSGVFTIIDLEMNEDLPSRIRRILQTKEFP